MSPVAGTHMLRTARATGCLGGCVAAVGLFTTGSLAAVPAGVALTFLASSDLTTRRFSLRLLILASIVVCSFIAGEAIANSAGHQLLNGLLTMSLLAAGSTVAWLATSGVSFGDVLLVAFAALVPAWTSPTAVLSMLIAAFIVAGGMVVVGRIPRRKLSRQATVALGPALLAGWIVALVIA